MFLVGVASIAFGVLLIWLGTTLSRGAGLPGLPDQIPFDAPTWKRNPRERDSSRSIRAAMVMDLCRNHLRHGMHAADVVLLLGHPDGDRWSGRYPHDYWNIGTLETHMDIDSAALVIIYDADGRIKSIPWFLD
ncbi:MAG: hypothetical protein KDB73_05020 [Planctomycetes bacterium]|nr:hypothetical protein [Planctomycetota bacterium]